MIHVLNRSEASVSCRCCSFISPMVYIDTKAVGRRWGGTVRVPRVWAGWLQLPLPPWVGHKILLQ